MEIIRTHFEVIDSTNTWAKKNAHSFAKDKITLITADEQKAGRGRFKRKWESPAKQNIYATFCFFWEKQDIGNIPQILALATLDVLKNFPIKLKWPNDLIISQKKVGGILTETTSVADNTLVIIGLGINVNMPQELLQHIDRPATSLFAEDGKVRDVEALILPIQQTFANYLQTFENEGFSPFLSSYTESLIHKVGDKIQFHTHQGLQEGTFLGITLDGALSLQLPSSEKITLCSGEILAC